MIDRDTKKILNPKRPIKHCNLQNKILNLMRRTQSIKFCPNHGPQSTSNSKPSIPRNIKIPFSKLTFICSFGAPYRSTRICPAYNANRTLNQYVAMLIRPKFNISEHAKITFHHKNKAILRSDIDEPIKLLGINGDDIIHASTMGINIAIKDCENANNSRVIEMFKGFTLKMLLKQIHIELGIKQEEISFLVSKGKIIDSDMICCKIHEYDVVHVLKRCPSDHHNCRHSVGHKGEISSPKDKKEPIIITKKEKQEYDLAKKYNLRQIKMNIEEETEKIKEQTLKSKPYEIKLMPTHFQYEMQHSPFAPWLSYSYNGNGYSQECQWYTYNNGYGYGQEQVQDNYYYNNGECNFDKVGHDKPRAEKY